MTPWASPRANSNLRSKDGGKSGVERMVMWSQWLWYTVSWSWQSSILSRLELCCGDNIVDVSSVNLHRWTFYHRWMFYHCSSCYCFRAMGIVSVVCSVVLSKGIKPFMCDRTRGATWSPAESDVAEGSGISPPLLSLLSSFFPLCFRPTLSPWTREPSPWLLL